MDKIVEFSIDKEFILKILDIMDDIARNLADAGIGFSNGAKSLKSDLEQ